TKSNFMASTLSKISSYFIKRFRVTILLSVAIVALGAVTYTNLLKREGFPSIDVPIVIMRAAYFVDDVDTVNTDITEVIERELNTIDAIEEYSSTTTANFAIFTVQFAESTSVNEGTKTIEEKIDKNVSLPSEATLTYQSIDAGSIDGEHDVVFFVNGDTSYDDLLVAANTIESKLSLDPLIGSVTVKEQYEEQTNPFTGELITQQTSFSRVGYKQNNQLVFRPAIAIGVQKKHDDIGTIELSDAIRTNVQELQSEGELNGFTITYGGDFADSLKDQISSLENNAFSGLLAVIVVLLLFLNFRSALATALFIPIVLCATFITLFIVGYSLNTIVLFSLILILGLFVDDAIVVVEAIDKKRIDGNKGLVAVQEAVKEIGIADVSGTITTILVFVPMLFITGILGDFIKLIPITVIIALSLSLLVALTIIPFFSYVLLLEEHVTRFANFVVFRYLTLPFAAISKLVTLIGNGLANVVSWYLKYKILAFIVALLGFGAIGVGSMYAQKLNFSVFPQPKDTDAITMSVTFPDGTNYEDALEKIDQIEKRLVVARTYIKDLHYFEGSNRSANAQIRLTDLNDRSRTAPEIIDDIKASTNDISDVTINLGLVSAGPPESDYQFALQIYDDDSKTLARAATDVENFLLKQVVGDQVTVTSVKTSSTDRIQKRNGAKYIEMQATLSDTSDTTLSLDLQEKVVNEYDANRLNKLGLQNDAISFDLGQESDNLESFNSTLFALGAAVIVMYALLVIQFDSFTLPFLILLAVPLSFLGLFPGLYVTDNALSFFVMLGVTGLVGIVVNNSIMLIEIAKQSRDEGASISDAIVTGVRSRFRPIITTSTTTIAGLLPLALTDPFWEPLAFSIIFGLISSSILVLTVLPVYYAVVEKLRSFIRIS
ncbi:efflux RND transporter permease subunit, partial [candidate division WWE3 bacterium]|nr:efflux RND transporter permease subunit [candidate division WWE3 bacterium]